MNWGSSGAIGQQNIRPADAEPAPTALVGRRYVGMARTAASRNTFSKPPNSQTTKL